MVALTKKRRLKKELGLFGVYSIATGTTLSAGLFLLPGLAVIQAGPTLVLAYLLAVIPLIPATLSILELATAMPRAGGLYYFLDRSLGPAMGAIGGLGTWFSLMLKVSFALVGMGAYLGLFFPQLPIRPVAIGLALLLGMLNLFGARKTGKLQVYLVVGLLTILGALIGGGLPKIDLSHFQGFFQLPFSTLLSTTGLVYISYVGITNVASLSEEVRDPERNIPLGVFLALGTAVLVYGLGTAIMVGLVPLDVLRGDLTPMATAADYLLGRVGVIVVSIGAILAFTSVANAGTLSASRYPLAMSRDRLMPRIFRSLGRSSTPWLSILLTTGVIVLILAVLDPIKIAKLASAFQLLMFGLANLAVIVLRESQIEAYDPGFRSPLYPWMQLFGAAAAALLIWEMGPLPQLFTLGLIAVAGLWYLFYGMKRVSRSGAIYHFLARVAEKRIDTELETEMRHILHEKGVRDKDPFDEVIAEARVLDLDDRKLVTFEELVEYVSGKLEQKLPATRDELAEGFIEGTRIGATPVAKGASLPHLRLFELEKPELLIVRSKKGIFVDVTDVHGEHSSPDPVHCLFFLVSPEADPRLHLRILAGLAGRVEDDDFMPSWLGARNEQVLKEILLRDERFLSLRLIPGTPSGELIGKAVQQVPLPDNVLIAIIRRNGRITVPRGQTVLEEDDRLTLIGDPGDIYQVQAQYANGAS